MDSVPGTETPGDTSIAVVPLLIGPAESFHMFSFTFYAFYVQNQTLTLIVAVNFPVLGRQLRVFDEVVAGGGLSRPVGGQVGVELGLGSLDGVVRGSVLQGRFEGGLRMGRPEGVAHQPTPAAVVVFPDVQLPEHSLRHRNRRLENKFFSCKIEAQRPRMTHKALILELGNDPVKTMQMILEGKDRRLKRFLWIFHSAFAAFFAFFFDFLCFDFDGN